MNKYLYYFITVFLFGLCILGANTVPDIIHIFDYMAAISISGMQFLVPGMSYVRLRMRTGRGDPMWNKIAWTFIVFSICVSILIVYNNLIPSGVDH